MIRRNQLLFLGAGLFAALAACHQAKPATSVAAGSYEQAPQADVDRGASQDRSAREVPGYAQPARERAIASPTPAPVAEPTPQDDPMRQFDIP